MSKLGELFQAREDQYVAATTAIMERLLNVSEAVVQTLGVMEQADLVWQDAQLIDGIVSLFGFLEISIGEEVELEDGKVITITENLQESLRRVIRVGVPLNIVEDGTPEEIIEYLEELNNEDGTNSSIDEHLVPVLPELSNKIDFDTDKLTEEQLEKLFNYERMNNNENKH